MDDTSFVYLPELLCHPNLTMYITDLPKPWMLVKSYLYLPIIPVSSKETDAHQL